MRYFKKLKIALLVFLMMLSVSTYVQAATYQTGTYKTNKKIYVYQKASTKAKKLTSIKKTVKVSVNAVTGKYGKVSYNSQSGYIYLPYTSYVYIKGTYTAKKKIYVYAKKSTKGKKLTSVSKGTAVTVTLVSGKYGKVTYNGKTGYLYLPYTTFKKETAKTMSASTKTSETSEGQTETPASQESQDPVSETSQTSTHETSSSEEQTSSKSQSSSKQETTTTETSSSESTYAIGTYKMTASGYMRTSAGTSGSIITTLSKGTVFTVVSVENVKWGYTTYNGMSGYVSLKNATMTSTSSDVTSTITPTASGTSKKDYLAWMIDFAADDTHGYSQVNRTMNPDVDCSSFVYYALYYNGWAGTTMTTPFRTINERAKLLSYGFEKVEMTEILPENLEPGDILWYRIGDHGHTEVYVGGGVTVGAHGCKPSEKNPGRSSDPGDQDGSEVSLAEEGVISLPWMEVYRHKTFTDYYADHYTKKIVKEAEKDAEEVVNDVDNS